MRKHPISLILEAGVIAVSFVVLALSCLVIWVATGPRSVNFLSPTIENVLTRGGQDYMVKVQDTYLSWDSWEHPIGIRVRNVRFFTKEYKLFAVFPEISLRFNVPALLVGNISIQSLVIRKPEISLSESPDGIISFGFRTEGSEQTTPLSDVIGSFFIGRKPGTTIDNILIEDADLKIGNAHGVFFTAPNVQMRLLRIKDGVLGYLDLAMQYENQQAMFNGEFSYRDKEEEMTLSVDFNNVHTKMLARLFASEAWGEKLDMPVSGWVDISMNLRGAIDYADFSLDAGPGTVTYPKELPETLSVKRLTAKGHITHNLEYIQLDQLKADLLGPVASASMTAVKEDNGYRIKAKASGQNMPVNELYKYWPISLAPITREWIVTNIKDGMIPEASVSLSFNPGDMQLPAMPEGAIDSHVHVKDATVHYVEGYPVASKVNGVAHITGKIMDVALSGGSMLTGTTVTAGRVFVPDLNAADTQMQLNLDVKAPAADIVTFVSHPDIDAAKELGLESKTIQGNFAGNVALDFIAFRTTPQVKKSGDTWEDVDYKITSKLLDISQPGFMGDLNVEGLNGDLALDNKALVFKGKGVANGVPAGIDLTHDMTGKAAASTQYTLNASLLSEDLAKFDLPKLSFLNGNIAVKATVKEAKSSRTSDIVVDLEKAGVDFSQYGWSKPADVPATATLTVIETPGKPTLIPAFTLKGHDIDAKGKIALNEAMDDFSTLSFDKMNLGRSKLDSLTYEQTGSNTVISIKGESLDASQMTSGDAAGHSFKKYLNTDATLDVGKLYLSQASALLDVKGTLRCGQSYCKSVQFKGATKGGKPFSFEISGAEGQRKALATAADAGELLRALDLFETMDDGVLELKGDFDDDVEGRPLDGSVVITKYSIAKAPVLTKILTLASITGIFETLGGKGIGFDKLKAPFVLKDDLITLKEAKAVGSSLGLTAAGTIDVAAGKMQLKGTVVPSYTLNSILGKIPILGQMLTGGKDGGVFAANYTLKGPTANPEVSVNPLSILAPGFLRNLFDLPMESGTGDEKSDAKRAPPKVQRKNTTKKQ